MKLTDYVAMFLAAESDRAFVGQGGCIVHLIDSIARNGQIRPVSCENEQGAAIAAEAYARVSGRLGIAVATSGPGFVNLIQGIACAFFDSIPCLFITGQVPTKDIKADPSLRQMGFQEMDVTAMAGPIVKRAVLLRSAAEIKKTLQELVWLARSGRPGPVLLDLPDDLQRADVDVSGLEGFEAQQHEIAPSSAAVRICEIAMEASIRPVAVIGGGVKHARCENLMRRFLEKTGMPFATTWATIDLFTEDTPGLIGNFGVSANRPGNFAVQNSDLIVSFGCKLDTHQTGNPAIFAPNAKKIMIDIDAAELAKKNGLLIDLPVQADLRDILPELIVAPWRWNVWKWAEWKETISGWRRKYPICPPAYYEQQGHVNPYVFMNELSLETSEGDIIITDAGATLTWTMQGYRIRKPQTLFSAFNHSPMGYALPASIGAQFAAPARQVVCITGDGGMQMNIQELETIAYHGLPVKIFVMDNQEYGIIKQTQDTWLDSRHFASEPAGGLGFPDFRKIALAYGLAAATIEDNSRLCVIREVLRMRGPVLCDVKIKQGTRIIPKLEPGRALEDLSPLLPREELEQAMKEAQ